MEETSRENIRQAAEVSKSKHKDVKSTIYNVGKLVFFSRSDSNLEDDSMHTDVLEHNGGKHPLSAPARTPEEGDESSLKR